MPPTRSIALCCHRLLLAALLALVAAGVRAATPAAGAAGPWRVAIVMSVDASLPAARLLEGAMRGRLQAAAPGGVTFFTDTLDAARFSYADLAPEFLALARKKYAAQRVDLVLGVGDDAAAFVRQHHGELWPGAPAVLVGLDDAVTREIGPEPGVTYLRWRLDIDGTLDLIETLQPAARRLVVLGGDAASDRDLTARVVTRARLRPRWQPEVWDSLSFEELRIKLASLDAGSAVVYTTMYRDATGRAVFPVDALAGFASAARAPIYGMYRTYVGRGAAAGSVVDFEDNGRRAADLAIGLLNGTATPASGTAALVLGRCAADYAQLRAHGLDASALPSGCELRNPPRNLWTEYRAWVLAAAAVLALQALTIGALLLQRRRRRQAESAALQRGAELSRAMRLAAMGELTASIAHEINQPLGAILSNADAADLLLQGGKATNEELREILADIRRDDLRAHEVIRRLRALLGKREVEHAELHLHAVLDEALALLAPAAARRGVAVERRFECADDRLLGDPVQLLQVLINLAQNAMDAMDDTVPDARQLSVVTADRGDAIELAVADRGSGIEPSRHSAVFESFHTTKPHGMGLGLSIVRAIVQAHEGRVDVAARDGGGTRFTVTLPRRLGAPQRQAQPAAPVCGARA